MERLGVIIVAGGSGSRMGAELPKQFLQLCGEEILVRSLRAFMPYTDNIVVVLPETETDRWRKIVASRSIEHTHKVCTGGQTRFHSVKNGLKALGDCDVVAIHDAVRPLVSRRVIDDALSVEAEFGSAVPVVEQVDSFRVVTPEGVRPIDRSTLRAVQTPQIFRREILDEAYRARYMKSFTDDATVVEHAGYEVAYSVGDRCNLKITTPDDLLLAEAFLSTK